MWNHETDGKDRCGGESTIKCLSCKREFPDAEALRSHGARDDCEQGAEVFV